MAELSWPNGSKVEPPCTDAYGPRGWSAPGVRAYHTGDDSAGYAKLRAVGAGTVIETGVSSWAGNYVDQYLGTIAGHRMFVRYCHLAAPSHLRRGDSVARAGLIGIMGETGVAFGVHLHLEMYRDRIDRGGGTGPHDVGTTVDPRAFIRAHLAPPSVPKPAGPSPALLEEDEDMNAKLFARRETKIGSKRTEWTLAHPDFGKGLAAGQSRVIEISLHDRPETVVKVTERPGLRVTTSPMLGDAWGRTHCRAFGNAPQDLPRAHYVPVQNAFEADALAMR